ncbi:SGNH/GDSL hydrolase family protein [Desulfatitalea tepidiphila]|uniref:SGNH/GDSL hydrolase family protein n=1 Tax=Desulfatitalea tepidiphila TaxID=1185843 RepID=UPI000A97F338|nr:SGNH/GDSL hydrolase family protein [Desulfatitalea tepidiphila]
MMRGYGNAFAIFMMPVLLAQAIHVRRVTPRLPEPSGDRSGIFGSGRDLRLLIIGDSAASGVGAGCQRQALSGQLVYFLGGNFRVTWKLDAQTGRTIKDVVALLEAATPKKVDVLVASVGVNDVTRGTPVKNWISRHEKLIDIATSQLDCRHILLSSIPPMHLFPALPQPLRWYLGERARRLNFALEQHLAGRPACRVVSPGFPPEPAFMAADGFHPGPAAYSHWARHLEGIIREVTATSA